MGSVFAALVLALALALGSASTALAKPPSRTPAHGVSVPAPRSSAKHAPAAHAAGHKIA